MMGALRIISLLVLAVIWAPIVSKSGVSGSPRKGAGAQSVVAQNATPAVLPGPLQPVPFSHKQHAGTLQLPCEFCHTISRSGETLAIPRAAMCMQCHQTIDTGNPGVQKLSAYAKSGTAIPWIRIYQLPSFVNFSHKTHLLHGATCQECHGHVQERVQLYKEADISMAGCIRCHTAKKASTECDTCHALQQ